MVSQLSHSAFHLDQHIEEGEREGPSIHFSPVGRAACARARAFTAFFQRSSRDGRQLLASDFVSPDLRRRRRGRRVVGRFDGRFVWAIGRMAVWERESGRYSV